MYSGEFDDFDAPVDQLESVPSGSNDWPQSYLPASFPIYTDTIESFQRELLTAAEPSPASHNYPLFAADRNVATTSSPAPFPYNSDSSLVPSPNFFPPPDVAHSHTPYDDSALYDAASFASYFNDLDSLPHSIIRSTDGMSTLPPGEDEIPSLGEPVPLDETLRLDEILGIKVSQPPLSNSKSSTSRASRTSKSTSGLKFHPYAGVSQSKLRGFSAIPKDIPDTPSKDEPPQSALPPIENADTESIFQEATDILIKHALNVTPFLFEQEKKRVAMHALSNVASQYDSGKRWAESNTHAFYRSVSPMPSANILATCKRVARELITRGFELRPSVWSRISESKHQQKTSKTLIASFPPKFIFKLDEQGRLWAFENDVILDVVLYTIVELGYFHHITDLTLKSIFCTAATAVKCALLERSTRREHKFGVAEFKPLYDSFIDYIENQIVPYPELLSRWEEYTSYVYETLKDLCQ